MQIDRTAYQYSDSLPIEMLDAYLNAEVSEAPCQLCKEHPEQKGKRAHFHGSDIGACPRQTYFNMTEGKLNHETGVKAAFLQDGHLHEAMMLQALSSKFNIIAPKNSQELREAIPMWEKEKIAEFVADKTSLIPSNGDRTFLLIGHVDGFIVIDGEDQPYLLECKAVKDYTWDKVKKGEISDTWYGQVQVYMFMMGIKRSYLLVKNRGTSEMLMPIRIDFNAEWITKKLRMLVQIYKCVNTNTEVPKPKDKKGTDSDCRWCQFNSKCY
jgi:hypothetical protein